MTFRPRLLALVAVLPLLGGCSVTGSLPGFLSGSGSVGDPTSPADTQGAIEQLETFTVTDLTAADADAVKNHDDIAHACYPTLIDFVNGLPKPGESPDVGAFTTFQKARDIRNVVAAGVPKALLTACAPLVMEVRGDILGAITGLPTTH